MSEWAREYKSLKQKANTIDKETFKLLAFTKTTTLKNEIQNLIDFHEKKEFERHIEQEDLYTFITAMKKDINNLKDGLKHYSKNPTNLSKIQEASEKIEDKMTKFKEKQMVNFDTLLEEEATLSHEIELIADKIETYDAALESQDVPAAPKGRPFRAMNQDDDFDNFRDSDNEEENNNDAMKPQKRIGTGQDLAKIFKQQVEKINLEMDKLGGGLAVGWDNDDHQVFLKVRTKHKNNIDKIAFVSDCMTSLPFMSEDDITDHIEKFKRYMELEEMKKKVTKEYKENKENEKRNMMEVIKQEDLRKEEQAKQRMNPQKAKEEREKKKEKLKEWKASRIAKQEVEEEKVKEAEVAKKKDSEVDKLKKEAVQRQLQEYKEQKEMERIRQKEREEYRKALQQRHLDKQELERLKEKEENLIKKNLELVAMKKKKEQEKAERMQKIKESSNNAFLHVKPKLNEETKAAVGRKREKFDPKKDEGKIGGSFGGSMVRMVGRAIPAWRQGL